MKVLGDSICEGDVILSNHPCAGGSHLPDLTVITPVRPDIYSLIRKLRHCVACSSNVVNSGNYLVFSQHCAN